MSLFEKFEEILSPIFEYAFTEEGIEFIEEASELLNILLYNSITLSQKLWSYYPILVHIVTGKPTSFGGKNKLSESRDELTETEVGWGSEYFPKLLGCFQNYIAKSRPILLAGEEENAHLFIESLLNVIDRGIESGLDKDEDSEIICAFTLLITLLENFQGLLDNYLPMILFRSLEYFAAKHSNRTKVICIEVLMLALYNNPGITIGYLQQKSALEAFLESWYSLRSEFTRGYQKKRVLLGLASMLHVPESNLPKCIHEAIPNIINEEERLTVDIIDLREKNKDSDWKALSKRDSLNVDERKDDSIYDEDINEVLTYGGSLLYDSPLDKIDEIAYLQDALLGVKNRDENAYEQLLSNIESNARATFQRHLHKAFDDYARNLKKAAAIKN
eukprot:TRINITY_DN6057_c0_g1_i1.p1 TRINITY_DN6057_c0_g1~~TRINITY_DN6057_c0_g1_i1.p1  ORF type:complete len:389 (-),score=86.62 TRINITY_DN6057_c0_g1_i1:128-1294(-)